MEKEEIQAMRRSYSERPLELPADPMVAFRNWLREATEVPAIVEANAMVLSTFAQGKLTSRSVLLKDVTDAGLSFFTNYNSRKAKSMAENSQVALIFPWYAMERQVSLSGSISKLSESESDAYFATRPRGSQIGAELFRPHRHKNGPETDTESQKTTDQVHGRIARIE